MYSMFCMLIDFMATLTVGTIVIDRNTGADA